MQFITVSGGSSGLPDLHPDMNIFSLKPRLSAFSQVAGRDLPIGIQAFIQLASCRLRGITFGAPVSPPKSAA